MYYQLIRAEVERALLDRNASAKASERLTFRQCFHFRYADTTRMLTVGGLLLNPADAAALGDDPFAGLPFIRAADDPFEICPPLLTGREVRHLSRQLPHIDANADIPSWLDAAELENFRRVYRYYPVFAESEL